jgi:beta-lactamase regulating signal transducer with metallopeptidase domain
MTSLAGSLSAPAAVWLQLLLDLALKGAIVLLAAGVYASFLRRASAAARHTVWSVAVCGVLAMPLLSLVLPSWRAPLLPSLAPVTQVERVFDADQIAAKKEFSAPVVAPAPADDVAGRRAVSAGVGAPASNRTVWLPFSSIATGAARSVLLSTSTPSGGLFDRGSFNWAFAALMVWLAGAATVLARLLLGTLRVWWLARGARRVTENSWVALARMVATRLRLRRPVVLLKSEQVELPMTWGAVRSVVFLPEEADEWSPSCRSIVLLHELAHVKRRDCLTQSLAQLACALYWFNPLVWLAARRLRVERELACDDYVLEVGTKASDYAGHLLEIASSLSEVRSASPVTAGMAGSQLERRVQAILDPSLRRHSLNRRSAWRLGLGAATLIVPLSVLQPWASATSVLPAESLQVGQISIGKEPPPDQPSVAISTTAAQVSSHDQSASTKNAANVENDEEKNTDSASSAPAEAEEPAKSPGAGQSAGQSTELTPDQIIQMRIHGVTPEFIESIRRQGFDDISIKQLVEMRIHGIDDSYIQQARTWGGSQLTIRDLVQLKVSGVSAEYIKAMKDAGYDNLSINKLSAMSIHGVTPAFIASMRSLGYNQLTVDQVTSLRIHGVNEPFVREARQWAGANLSINDLLQMRIHGVTPEYAQRMKALGFGDISVNKLTEMRIHGVDEAFIKEMRDLGFNNLTLNQLLQMRIHGVNADYVRKLRAAGLKNVSLDQMLEMKIHGIDRILLKEGR